MEYMFGDSLQVLKDLPSPEGKWELVEVIGINTTQLASYILLLANDYYIVPCVQVRVTMVRCLRHAVSRPGRWLLSR